MAELTEFELERSARMQKNAEMLRALGVDSAAASIRDAWAGGAAGQLRRKTLSAGTDGAPAAPRQRRTAPVEEGEQRRSARHEGKERPCYAEERHAALPRAPGAKREPRREYTKEELLEPWVAPKDRARTAIHNALKRYREAYEAAVPEEAARAEQQALAGGKRPSQRPDLKALQRVTEAAAAGDCTGRVNQQKRAGAVPGMRPGDTFLSRAELICTGMHFHTLNGIDTMPVGEKEAAKAGHWAVAVSVITSGNYSDDVHEEGALIPAEGEDAEAGRRCPLAADELVITGQGQNDLLGNKQQMGDQALTRGNAALAASCALRVPVRVCRKQADDASYMKDRVSYTYLGTFTVTRYWQAPGDAGFMVYSFLMKATPCTKKMYLPPPLELDFKAPAPAKREAKKEVAKAEASSDDEGGREFEVEGIVGERMRGGATQYLVKWKGYDKASDNTWEAVDNLKSSPKVLAAWEASKRKGQRGAGAARGTKRKRAA